MKQGDSRCALKNGTANGPTAGTAGGTQGKHVFVAMLVLLLMNEKLKKNVFFGRLLMSLKISLTKKYTHSSELKLKHICLSNKCIGI